MNISISEIFDSIQGEGTGIGLPALFVRLQGCNLTCSWCDTPYTWKPGQNHDFRRVAIADLAAEVCERLGTAHEKTIVLTGGEPLLQQDGLAVLINQVDALGSAPRYEIETNGTIFPDALASAAERIQLNVSPKLANSHVERAVRYVPDALARLADQATFAAYFKFVVVVPEDIDEILRDFAFVPRNRMIIMPEGVTRAGQMARLAELVEVCKAHELRLIPRLHTLIWENKRGV